MTPATALLSAKQRFRLLRSRTLGRSLTIYEVALRVRSQADLPLKVRLSNLRRASNPLSQPKVVIVVSSMRTGSTLMCGLAAQLPNVHTTYEALNPIAFGWMKLRGARESAGLISDLSTGGKVTVTKIFPAHLKSLGTSWDELADELPDASWIHLYRADLLAQFSSLKRAEQSGDWTVHAGDVIGGPPSIAIDPKELSTFCEETVEGDRLAFEALHHRQNYLRVSYEEFTERPREWIDSYFGQFLDERLPSDATPFEKQGPTELLDSILNIAEIVHLIDNGRTRHPLGEW